MRPNLNFLLGKSGKNFAPSPLSSPPSRGRGMGEGEFLPELNERGTYSQKGVTLIELIMAMIILAFVALSSAAMIGAQIQGMITSTDLTAAGNLARLEMERLNNIAYAAIANGSSVIAPYTVTRSVTTIAGGGGASRKDITLTVQRTGSAAILWTLYGSIASNVVYAP
jgi:prepilin-type N-terminal cleavage/methylation domain-containing protein